MSHKGGEISRMESVRLLINEHMASVGEEILCVLEKQQRGADVCFDVKFNVRVFVLERLSAAAEFMCNLFQREYRKREIETLLDTHNKLLDMDFDMDIRPFTAEERSSSLVQEKPQPPQHEEKGSLSGFLRLPACKEEVSPEDEKCSSLVPEEPEPPRIKEEPEDPFQRPEEADWPKPPLLPAVKSEGDDRENRDTEPVAGTSTEHMQSQAYMDYWASSHPQCPDIAEDEWDPSVDQPPLNAPKPQKTQHVEGQRFSLSDETPQDRETHPTQSHAGKKSFSCAVCDKVFHRKDRLTTHMSTHTGERPFGCTICSKTYIRQDQLTTHMRTHTKPFTCTVCGKGFGYSNLLKIHMRTHTGEKPFVCNFCTKGFCDSGDLKRHIRTHTGEKPFACTVCDKGFSDKRDLKQHMKTHAGGETL